MEIFPCLSCPSANFAFQHSGFVPREWLAAKVLLRTIRGRCCIALHNGIVLYGRKWVQFPAQSRDIQTNGTADLRNSPIVQLGTTPNQA